MKTGRIALPGLTSAGRIDLTIVSGGGSAPGTPTGVNAISGDSHITLSWNSVLTATSYRVKRSLSSTGPFSSVLATPSSAGYVDSMAVNGTTYYYVVSALNSFGESANSGIVSGTPAVVDQGSPLVISAMGDSITGDQGWGNPFTPLASALSIALGGRSVTTGFNAQHNGYSTSYYLDPTQSALLDSDIASMVAVGTTHCQLMFGANDQRFDILTPKENFWANLTTLMNRLNAAGIIAVLHSPTYVQVGSFSGAFTRAGATLMESYIPGLRALTNGTTKLFGDVSSYANFRDHPEFTWTGNTSDSGLHPTAGTTNGDVNGVAELTIGWVAGWVDALTPATLPTAFNQDGTMNVSGWRTYYDNWSIKAWSARLGLKSTISDTDMPSLATAPIVYGSVANDGTNLLYDRLGEGVAPYYIDGSLGTPNQDLHLMTSAFQVFPNTWGPTHAALSPHNGNWVFGMPPGSVLHYTTGSVTHDLALVTDPYAMWFIKHSDDYWGMFAAGDYDSDFSSIHFIAQNAVRNVGIDAIQSTANYNLQKALMPKRNVGAGPYDATTGSVYQLYKTAFARGDSFGSPTAPVAVRLGYPAKHPICIDRGWINAGEALIIDMDGVMTCQPGPTTRDGSQYPIPSYKFPDGERPIKICLSSMCEFAAVIVQDLNRNVCKVRVFAINGGALSNHSPIYTGLANNCGVLQIIDVGAFDIGLKLADSIEMACDSSLATPDILFAGNYLASQSHRDGIRSETGERNEFCMWARHGFIAVASKQENKLECWNISAYIESVNQAYMVHDQATWDATFAAMQAGNFPLPMSGGTMPTLINSWTIQRPTCLLASVWLVNDPQGSGGHDHDKLLIGSESGLVTVINTSPIVDRIPLRQFKDQPFDIFGSFQVGSVGSNITEMCWSKYAQDTNNPRAIATGVMTVGGLPCESLNTVHVCCRADRAIYSVCTRYDSTTQTELSGVYRTIKDKRIKDPVGVSLSTRQMVFQIADFEGMQVHSIQVGPTGNQAVYDSVRAVDVLAQQTFYPDPNDHTVELAYTGSLKLAGAAIAATANNIN